MSLENATKISELVATNPPGTDPVSQGDDHIRMIKLVMQNNAIKSEIGQSGTPANNFTLDASADNGTMKLARNSGQDIMTVDASGKVEFPQNKIPVFSASGASTSIAGTGAFIGIPAATETADTNNNYDTATSRFQPTVAGWYLILLGVQAGSGAGDIENTTFGISINKNGVNQSPMGVIRDWSDFTICNGFRLTYFNGTTDWVSPIVQQATGSAKNFSVLEFAGHLVWRAQ